MRLRNVIVELKNEVKRRDLRNDEYVQSLLFYIFKDYQMKNKIPVVLDVIELIEYLELDQNDYTDVYRLYIELNEREKGYESYRTIRAFRRCDK